MKTITIDSEAYKMLVKKIDCIFEYVRDWSDKQATPPLDPDKVWIDDREAVALLGCSRRSMQRYRSNGKVTYSIRQHKVYYPLSEIHRLMRGHIVPGKPQPEMKVHTQTGE